jgi:N-acyl amino acid synthase of PEP-CTERM/exosortase system
MPVVSVPTGERMSKIYEVRYQVYCEEKKFIDPARCSEHQEFDEYDPYSVHFTTGDTSSVVGTARLILETPFGFPFEHHCMDNLTFDLSVIPRSNLGEISRLAISKSLRRMDAASDDPVEYGEQNDTQTEKVSIKKIKSMAFDLYKQVYQECKRRNITHCVALMEKSLWYLLRQHHFLFEPIGDEIDCYGPVRPYLISSAGIERRMSERAPDLYRRLIEGLDDSLLPHNP